MQILQWLFKGTHEQEKESTFSAATKREAISDQKGQRKDIILLKHHRAHRRTKRTKGSKFGCKNLMIFACICRKDIQNACFYSTVNLNRRQHFVFCMKMKSEEIIARGVGIKNKADSTTNVGKKVLPISGSSLSTSREKNDHCGILETKDQIKGGKKKSISRMKELLRWAAAEKAEKGGEFNGRKVLKFRRRGTLKAISDDDQVINDSHKTSFKWDVESCSNISSAYSAFSITSSAKNGQTQIAPSPTSVPPEGTDYITFRKGNWITTDSEFVVLEL